MKKSPEHERNELVAAAIVSRAKTVTNAAASGKKSRRKGFAKRLAEGKAYDANVTATAAYLGLEKVPLSRAACEGELNARGIVFVQATAVNGEGSLRALLKNQCCDASGYLIGGIKWQGGDAELEAEEVFHLDSAIKPIEPSPDFEAEGAAVGLVASEMCNWYECDKCNKWRFVPIKLGDRGGQLRVLIT